VVFLRQKLIGKDKPMSPGRLYNIAFYDDRTQEIAGYLARRDDGEPFVISEMTYALLCEEVTSQIRGAITKVLVGKLADCSWRTVDPSLGTAVG
jgi:hypothetical protein